MQTLTLNLKLTENGKRLTLHDLINKTGVWLRGQCPGIMDLPECYDSHHGYKQKKEATVSYVGCEIEDKILIRKKMKLIFDQLVYETDGAYLLQFGDDKVWCPKSKAEILNEDTRGPEHGGEVEIPRWLVEKKGLEGYEV